MRAPLCVLSALVAWTGCVDASAVEQHMRKDCHLLFDTPGCACVDGADDDNDVCVAANERAARRNVSGLAEQQCLLDVDCSDSDTIEGQDRIREDVAECNRASGSKKLTDEELDCLEKCNETVTFEKPCGDDEQCDAERANECADDYEDCRARCKGEFVSPF